MLLEINNDVFGVIFSKLDIKDKCRLGLTNKMLSRMIYGESSEESEIINDDHLNSFHSSHSSHPSHSSHSSSSEYLIDAELGRHAHTCGVTLSFRDGDIKRSAVMQLLFGRGCMFCSRSRVRKVYKPFNIRCCTDCLYDQTISSYELDATYNVSDRALTGIYKDIPFMSVEKFNPNSSYYRYYTMNFYWIKTIERVVFRGKSLAVMRGIVQKQRDHEESLRRREEERKLAEIMEKRQPRISKIREYISEMGEDIDSHSHSHSQAFKDALARYMNRSIPPPTKKAFVAKWESLQSEYV